MYPLFDAYRELANALPRIPLGEWPTPVSTATGLGGNASVFIKHDNVSAPRYGGNKVRKLELLLADAKARGCKTVITFGGAGSNHAFATALYAPEAGLHAVLLLGPQANTPAVRRALLRDADTGADVRCYPDYALHRAVTDKAIAEYTARDGIAPCVIPPGGSSALGAIGFVNAAFELKRQVDEGHLPAPGFIYAASGTMGTTVGLALGLRAAGLPTRVIATSVTEPFLSSETNARKLFGETMQLLRDATPSFPEFPFESLGFTLRNDFFAPGYGIPTRAALDAISAARDAAGIALEPVYTGRAFAALLADLREGKLDGANALFWNTYNSRELPEPNARPEDLPETAQVYFHTPDIDVSE
jgi:1-aminocyclopropane-1-carboxylate deaminase/D-cysteine desulfhydrase-like pyridoxal-dependent ACC family enzyme